MNRTKIVCTLGPASQTPEVIHQLIAAGMNVARLNFSHGAHPEHRQLIQTVRQVAQEVNRDVAILIDLRGAKIRIGEIAAGSVTLQPGAEISISAGEGMGNEQHLTVNYPGLIADVQPGNRILIDDGLIELEITAIRGETLICRVLTGGEVKSRKGINVPDVYLNTPTLTDKDLVDLQFAVEEKVDFVALSFVQRAADIIKIKEMLEKNRADIEVIAKIESRSGVNNLDTILAVTDGIMVARGDLGIEVPAEEVPVIQKKIIQQCNRLGKPVIVATQMLDSMIRNPIPTRAEASDVANAVLDGADAIMLSGETAAGKYPVAAVETMARIAARTEDVKMQTYGPAKMQISSFPGEAIADAACLTAMALGAKAIITPTITGRIARNIAKHRTRQQIIAITPTARISRRLCLSWGITSMVGERTSNSDELIRVSIERAVQSQMINKGDLVVTVAGVPSAGLTNLLRIQVVGESILKGQGIGSIIISGKVCRAGNPGEADQKIGKGDILVVRNMTGGGYNEALEKAAGLVAETGGITSDAAIIGLNLGLPTLVGVEGAFNRLEDGLNVSLDPIQGLIYIGDFRTVQES